MEHSEQLSDQRLAVRNWRYDEARQAGLTGVEAMLFAESDRDLAELRKLVSKGCPLATARDRVVSLTGPTWRGTTRHAWLLRR